MELSTPTLEDQQRLQELREAFESYGKAEDFGLIEKAYLFAAASHIGQLRVSGEDYIIHPWNVALILANLHLDARALTAALLHDVVEDTIVLTEDVKMEFGEEIAYLVEGVTKLSKIHFRTRELAEVENYRKMLLAMAQDVRVILIKLADRLHNMRTIEHLEPRKQAEISKETLEIYAPIAHRLGLGQIKWELEDLSFHVLYPRRYEELVAMVADRREERERQIDEASMILAARLIEEKIEGQISGRAKHLYAIYDKMTRKGREFNEIYDLLALRVLLSRNGKDGIADCYATIGLIHSLWKPIPGRFKDYIALPKLNHYSALHTTVIGPYGTPLEIQVRTRQMNAMAEFGIAAHWLYKGIENPKEVTEWQGWLTQLSSWQGDHVEPDEFFNTLRSDLFSEEVYVFTPQGEIKRLPIGSTPVDFAYAVHTDVGHSTVGAKVNGRMVPLHYRLENGDFVEVLTSKQPRGPSRDWMSYVVSSRARTKIRAWLARETREETESRGMAILEESLKAQGLFLKRIQGTKAFNEVLTKVGYPKISDFYVALGGSKIQPGNIVNKIITALKTQEEPLPALVPARVERSPQTSEKVGIAVEGDSSIFVRLARCCAPLPGDEIVGYVSVGHGVTVHRIGCPNVSSLQTKTPKRFLSVNWTGESQQTFRAQVGVNSWDRPRLLEDVARTFAEAGANVVAYSGNVEGQTAAQSYTIEVGDVKALEAIIIALKNIDGVLDAYRLKAGN